jgi:UPF0271 protein
MGYDPLSIKEDQFTTPATLNELSYDTTTSIRFRVAVEIGKIQLQQPSPVFLDQINKASSMLGDILQLSDIDKELLALALELKEKHLSPVIISDDYSVQNVADQFSISYLSLSTFGIRYQFKWILNCPACHRRYPPYPKVKICPICGTQLKRRVLGKKPAQKSIK